MHCNTHLSKHDLEVMVLKNALSGILSPHCMNVAPLTWPAYHWHELQHVLQT